LRQINDGKQLDYRRHLTAMRTKSPALHRPPGLRSDLRLQEEILRAVLGQFHDNYFQAPNERLDSQSVYDAGGCGRAAMAVDLSDIWQAISPRAVAHEEGKSAAAGARSRYQFFGIDVLRWLLGGITTFFVVAVVVIFQPEIRRMWPRSAICNLRQPPRATGEHRKVIIQTVERPGRSSHRHSSPSNKPIRCAHGGIRRGRGLSGHPEMLETNFLSE